MRNLKRALSLLLSSTMVLGMLVMGGSAAGYKDVDDSNVNQEAIEVLQTVGIMTGDQNGNFNPDGSITRNEMAVVMAHLLNLDYDYYRGTNPFTDVPEWAAPYVAACAAEGVVAGIGNGQYGGNQKVTAAQASLMVMKALGYFQNAEDFGTDWQVATIRQASYINLFDNINANAESALTRGQVAQLVLNGLKAKMVDFTGDKGIQIGDVTVGYRAEYSYKTSAAVKYNTIDDGTTNIAENDQYYIQLGEELYNGNLKLNSHSADAFARPSRTWSFKGEEIGTYVNYDLMVAEYTTSVTGKEVYEAVGKTAFDKYDFASYVDGAENSDVYKGISRDNKGDVKETDRGALTQVFVNDDTKDVVVTVINTYLAQANIDYNEKKDEVDFKIYFAKGNEEIKTVSGEDFDIADIEKDDFVLVNYSKDTKAIEIISDVEILSEVEISKFSTNGTATSVTVDGTKYDDSKKLCYDKEVLDDYTDANLKDTIYNVYLDQYGYVIGVDIVEGASNYVFITGADKGDSFLSTKLVDANAIFMDGTSAVIKVKNDGAIPTGGALINSWYKYTKNSDDVYTLTAVTKTTDILAAGYEGKDKVAQAHSTEGQVSDNFAIDDKHISLNAIGNKRVYGNDESIYMVADLDRVKNGNTLYSVIKGVDEVITGVDNTKLTVWGWDASIDAVDEDGDSWTKDNDHLSYGVYTLYNNDGYVIAAVVVGESGNVSESIAYDHTGALADESYDKTTGQWTWTHKVIINGEEVVLTETNDEDKSVLEDKMTDTEGTWFTVKYDANGNVKDVAEYGEKSSEVLSTKIEDAVWNIEHDHDDDGIIVADFTANSIYSLKNKTLYDETKQKEGFRISNDVKVVLVQTVKGETTTEYYTGVDALDSVLKSLNDADHPSYEFNAIIEDGRATSVIIVDNNEQGAGQGPAGGQATDVKTVVMTDNGEVSLKGKDDKVINTQGYSYELWMRGPSQDAFNVAKTGKFDTGTPDFQLTEGSSYYLVVDGVKSDVITVTAPSVTAP